jgi:hypothetical protein
MQFISDPKSSETLAHTSKKKTHFPLKVSGGPSSLIENHIWDLSVTL